MTFSLFFIYLLTVKKKEIQAASVYLPFKRLEINWLPWQRDLFIKETTQRESEFSKV